MRRRDTVAYFILYMYATGIFFPGSILWRIQQELWMALFMVELLEFHA
jgi:hypothetical protein